MSPNTDLHDRCACSPNQLPADFDPDPHCPVHGDPELLAVRNDLRDRMAEAQRERDHWKREHDELFLNWQILAERTLVATTLVAEGMPADVEAELAPVRLEVLRRVLAGEAGRDDLTASLLPTLAEAEQRRDERTGVEVERLRARLAEEVAVSGLLARRAEASEGEHGVTREREAELRRELEQVRGEVTRLRSERDAMNKARREAVAATGIRANRAARARQRATQAETQLEQLRAELEEASGEHQHYMGMALSFRDQRDEQRQRAEQAEAEVERLRGDVEAMTNTSAGWQARAEKAEAKVAEYEVYETHVSEIRARKNEALVQASLAAEAVRKLCAPERVANAAAYDLAADVLAELECIVRPHHTHYAPESPAPGRTGADAATDAHGGAGETQGAGE